MDNRVHIRPLVAMDILKMFGFPLQQTCQGFAVEMDGKLAAIAGVMIQRPLMIAFSIIRPGLEVSPRLIWRTALELWEKIKGLGYPVLYAIASPDIPGAPAFLERLGFTHIEHGVRGDIFKWQTR